MQFKKPFLWICNCKDWQLTCLTFLTNLLMKCFHNFIKFPILKPWKLHKDKTSDNVQTAQIRFNKGLSKWWVMLWRVVKNRFVYPDFCFYLELKERLYSSRWTSLFLKINIKISFVFITCDIPSKVCKGIKAHWFTRYYNISNRSIYFTNILSIIIFLYSHLRHLFVAVYNSNKYNS